MPLLRIKHQKVRANQGGRLGLAHANDFNKKIVDIYINLFYHINK
jgi:hypothetical protein